MAPIFFLSKFRRKLYYLSIYVKENIAKIIFILSILIELTAFQRILYI